RRTSASSRWQLWVLAAGLVGAIGGVLMILRPTPPALEPAPAGAASPGYPYPVIAGLAIAQPSADFALARDGAGDVMKVARGRCTVLDVRGGSALAVAGPVELRREARGVRVLRGRVDVAVHKRAAGTPPARVLVSHGAIEVMGTEFTVEQNP